MGHGNMGLKNEKITIFYHIEALCAVKKHHIRI